MSPLRTVDSNYLAAGDRVQLHPGCDAWMRGDRFGLVLSIYRARPGADLKARVEMDVSGRTYRVPCELLTRAD